MRYQYTLEPHIRFNDKASTAQSTVCIQCVRICRHRHLAAAIHLRISCTEQIQTKTGKHIPIQHNKINKNKAIHRKADKINFYL